MKRSLLCGLAAAFSALSGASAYGALVAGVNSSALVAVEIVCHRPEVPRETSAVAHPPLWGPDM